MSTKYADRAFISVNGARLADVQNASLKQTKNARVVPTMTPDGWNRGYVQGNTDIDIALTIAVQNQLSRPKLEAIDFENNDVSLTFIVGADQYVVTGLFNKDTNDSAGGIGDEVKTSFNFGGLKVTDAVGNSTLFDLAL